MNDRVRRTKPVLSAKTRVLDEKRAAFAAAQRAANAARNTQLLADVAWEQRAAAVACGRYETVAEHLEARAHVESLKRAALCAAERSVVAGRFTREGVAARSERGLVLRAGGRLGEGAGRHVAGGCAEVRSAGSRRGAAGSRRGAAGGGLSERARVRRSPEPGVPGGLLFSRRAAAVPVLDGR